MAYNDEISKPRPGFAFPVSFPEAAGQIKKLHFETANYLGGNDSRDSRPDILFISGDKPMPHGFPLTCYRRHGDIAIFSLPEELFPKPVAAEALDMSLKEFAKIDHLPPQSTKQTHFFVYRSYIAEFGKITLTRNLIQPGHRPYLYFKRAIDPRKLLGTETLLSEFKV